MYQPASRDDRRAITNSAIHGGMSLAGGVVLLVASALASGMPFLAIVGGGALAIYGVTQLRSKGYRRPGNTTLSAVLTGLGIVTAAAGTGILGGIGGFLLTASGIGLLAYGGWKLWQFRSGMKRYGA